MNLIPELSVRSPLAAATELRYLLYLFLLSEASSTGGTLMSKYRVADVRERFTSFGDEAVTEALAQLQRDKLVMLTRDGVIVGRQAGSKRNLFLPEDGSLESVHARLRAKMKDYVENALRPAHARGLSSLMERLIARSIEGWTREEYATFYQLVYELVYEESPREFTSKERGQIGYLVKTYDPVTLFKMIAHFILDSEQYTKSAPTLGLLLYFKDAVNLKVRNKTKAASSRKSMRSSKTKDEDF